jgi:hypothetical protein
VESVCNDEKMVDKVIVVSLGSRVFFGQGCFFQKALLLEHSPPNLPAEHIGVQ